MARSFSDSIGIHRASARGSVLCILVFAVAAAYPSERDAKPTSDSSPAPAAGKAPAAPQSPGSFAPQPAAAMKSQNFGPHPPALKERLWQERKALETLSPLLENNTSPEAPALAPFLGNLTSIVAGSGTPLLARMPDCSITLFDASYQLAGTAFTAASQGSIPGFETLLHDRALLATKADRFPTGCVDPTVGVPSRAAMFGSRKSPALYFGAVALGAVSGQGDTVYGWTYNPVSGSLSYKPYSASYIPTGVVAGDLNGDGIIDFISINQGSITVFLAKSDGSFEPPVNYSLALTQVSAVSGVVDDVNGDGKLDVVVAVDGLGDDHEILIFPGRGNGLLGKPTKITASQSALGLIAGKFSGKTDIVTGTGQVYLGNGEGTFTLLSTPAFAPPSVNLLPVAEHLAAGDFNHDGKLDLAAEYGGTVSICLGRGDGTFKAGVSYALNGNDDLLATDIDGDGNLDLYAGLANGGIFVGDYPPEVNLDSAYALMGRGDGTFSGATGLPFAFQIGGVGSGGDFVANLNSSGNIIDLNKDAKLDAITFVPGQGQDVFLSTWLGKGNGTFSAGPSLQISPFTYNGQTDNLFGGMGAIDSFAIADFNGDGIPDVLYAASSTYQGDQGAAPAGFFIATGNGDGSFKSPVFTKTPSFYADMLDYSQTVTRFTAADFNHDGKTDVMYYLVDSDYSDTGPINPIKEAVIQLGNGDGTFKAPILVPLSGGVYPGLTVPKTMPTFIADLNGDKIPDLVVEQYSGKLFNVYGNGDEIPGTQVAIYIGKGDGTFKAPVIAAAADNAIPLLVADMNGDGKPDLVTFGDKYGTSYIDSESELAVSLNGGDGVFKKPTIYSQKLGVYSSYESIGLSAENAVAADFNRDGKMDMILGQNVYLGNGDGTLRITNGTQGTQILDLGGNGYVFAGNFTTDGRPDLLWSNVLLLNEYGVKIAGGAVTSTTLTSNSLEQPDNDPVEFTAQVDNQSGAAIPAGDVVFRINGAAAATVALNSSGEARYTATSLKPGTYQVEATYQGNSTFDASGSALLTETILAPASPAPKFSPAGGTFTSDPVVTISDSTSGAKIYISYGTVPPTTSSTLYSQPIKIYENEQVNAIAVAPGLAASPVAKASFVLHVPPYAYTLPAQAITSSGATLAAEFNADEAATSAWFAYGTSKSALSSTTAKTSYVAAFVYRELTVPVTKLKSGTTYYFQPVATSAYGTTKGQILSFTTK